MLSRRHKLLFLIFLVLITTTVGCSNSNGTTSATPTGVGLGGLPGITVDGQSNAVVTVAEHNELGSILVNGDGLTLYAFMRDEPNVSNCSGSCAETWPPLLSSLVLAGEGVQSGLFALITRENGSSQLTYNGQPLYNFNGDRQLGDTNGQGVGGAWFVVSPGGGSTTTTDNGDPYDY